MKETFIMKQQQIQLILKALDAIQPYARTPEAGRYANQICHHIREFEATSPGNPLLEVLSGLYMALAYDNLWADYDAGQFATARTILETYANCPVLKSTDIENAIMEMETAGFNTTPIPIFVESSDENIQKNETDCHSSDHLCPLLKQPHQKHPSEIAIVKPGETR